MIRPGRKQTNWQPHGYQGFGFFIHGLWSGSPPDTLGRSPVRKSRTPGSVRGVAPYVDADDVYHQPATVLFVVKPSEWGQPRLN